MTVEGHIENGQIVLHGDGHLTEGVKVRVELLPVDSKQAVNVRLGTQFEHYKSVIGAINDLPMEFAAEHDRYIHGTPKK